ncbi:MULTISPECIES: hypothetical protein [Streptomyces althioticus group]|uniref:hypothetical protein n=1 Tax=Streptomyces althioticus group TaxID=2867194 RepID=UPI003511CC03|nr:hypothetical protein OG968_22075 [Streptomyces althioticus]
MTVQDMAAVLADKEFLSEDVVRAVLADDGLTGSTKKVGVHEGLEILGRKNDVWLSFEQWYEGLDEGGRKYMDLMLEAALVGLVERTVEGSDVREYDKAAREILEAEGALELTDPQLIGPVSTAVTRTIIKQTIKKNCATKWAGC